MATIVFANCGSSSAATAKGVKNTICTRGSEFEPSLCPLQIKKITDISIEQNGINAWGNSDQTDYSQFTVTPQQVATYFAKTKAATLHDIHYTLSESPCQAAGTVTFADGTVNNWRIDQLRVGRLSRSGQDDIGLYCKGCNFPPFKEQ